MLGRAWDRTIDYYVKVCYANINQNSCKKKKNTLFTNYFVLHWSMFSKCLYHISCRLGEWIKIGQPLWVYVYSSQFDKTLIWH